ncbi:MAG: aldehyde dehydrogenase family protein [Acidothermales bacterium]|nr:aldehyde dehydrogenase family protein [Acidothermales bacterium]
MRSAHEICAHSLIEDRVPAAGRYEPVRNPADRGQVVGHVALAEPDVVDLAVAAALRAAPGWGRRTANERADFLRTAAKLLEADDDARARLLTREHGKVIWESRLDIAGAATILRYYAEFADRLDAEVDHVNKLGTARIRRRPVGVTAVVVPWNYPVYLAFLMLVPALLAGNPVVVKPSEVVPLALTDVLTTLAEALPPGVVTVVQGEGATVGARLTAHPDVRAVLFTGSTATGRSIIAGSAGTVKRLGLELGGNDPAIVLDTAVVDDTMAHELVRGVYTSSGQVCYNVKRIYVHQDRYDELVEAFTAAAGQLVVGDGLSPDSHIGPVTTPAQRRKVQSLVTAARADGASVVEAGKVATGTCWDRGLFVRPTIVTGVSPDARLVQEEQFGPAVPILPFATDDEAVRMANDTEYGLAASVWSADADHADAVARRIEAGSVFVNAHRLGCSDLAMPFGGVKQSGLGRRHGYEAVEECTDLQTIAHITSPAALPGPART